MKTAPQIMAPLMIHHSILLSKHNSPPLPPKGQKPACDVDCAMKNRSSASVLSTALAICREEIALHLEADSRHTHTSQNMQMYIHTARECIHTCMGTNMCLCKWQPGESCAFAC